MSLRMSESRKAAFSNARRPMKPDAPANDEQAEEYMNKNTKVQMGVIKERLEKQAPK